VQILILIIAVGFTTGSGAGLLGYSTFPDSYAGAPTDDGVVMLFSSLPGGTAVPYDLYAFFDPRILSPRLTLYAAARLSLTRPGKSCKIFPSSFVTDSFISSHWVGLYHTFQGGCSGSGDMVSDTPPEGTETFGCPTSKDSCSGGGVDPIHNYMDYSDDACMTQFTAGQIVRLKAQMSTFRKVSL
jgi:hypothetical protein